MRTRDITFWTLWKGGELIACGALGALAADAGEIKSMHTAEKRRGRGASAAMLRHIIAEVRRRDDRAGMLCGALATPSARAPSLNGRVRDRQYDLPPKACAGLSRQPQPCFADQAAMRWTLMA